MEDLGEKLNIFIGLVSGHIPGSKNLFFKNLLTEDMCFKSDEELAQQISKSGLF